MNKESVLNSIKELREKSKKRKFTQSFDLILNLKGMDIKKGQGVDQYLVLNRPIGRDIKVCGLVDKDLAKASEEIFDETILKSNFKVFDKKKIKELSRKFDFFVAQASIMVDVAKTFGRTLGPKGKMPNPKTGCVVIPGADLKALQKRLSSMVRLRANKEPIIKVIVGKENMDDIDIQENILQVYNNLLQLLPQDKNNIKNLFLKLTMSKPVEIK